MATTNTHATPEAWIGSLWMRGYGNGLVLLHDPQPATTQDMRDDLARNKKNCGGPVRGGVVKCILAAALLRGMLLNQRWLNSTNGISIRIDYQGRTVAVYAPNRRRAVSRGPLVAETAGLAAALLTQQGYKLTHETRSCPGLTMAEVVG